MTKVRLHIDPRGVNKKPTENEWGGISQRVLRNSSIKEVTVQQLAQKIEGGHTICPAVLNGSKAADWQEQQVFMVDIDNADTEKPQLSQERALAICEEHGLTPAIYYQTFSHSKSRPKFRLVFIMDSIITEPSTRRMIVERLISIFPQSDKACTNANRIFLGTDKEVVLHSKNARISAEEVLSIPYDSPPSGQPSKSGASRELRSNPELAEQIRNFDFLSYLAERNGAYSGSGNIISFENCEVCGHKNDLRYYKEPTHFTVFLPAAKLVELSLTI